VLIAHSQQRMYFTYAGGTVFQPGSLTPCEELTGPDAPAPAGK